MFNDEGLGAAMELSALREQVEALNRANTTAFVSVKTPKRYQWNPQEDMTAYELSLLLPVFLGADAESIVRVHPALHRHLLEMV